MLNTAITSFFKDNGQYDYAVKLRAIDSIQTFSIFQIYKGDIYKILIRICFFIFDGKINVMMYKFFGWK